MSLRTRLDRLARSLPPPPRRPVERIAFDTWGRAVDAGDMRWAILMGRGLRGMLDGKPGTAAVLGREDVEAFTAWEREHFGEDGLERAWEALEQAGWIDQAHQAVKARARGVR